MRENLPAMSETKHFRQSDLESDLQAVAATIQTLANKCQGDSIQLLALLRLLENLHQEIRETLFQDSLPDNRQALYKLLRDIEASGGWPYIYRMKLQALLKNLEIVSDGELTSILSESSDSNHSQETQQKD